MAIALISGVNSIQAKGLLALICFIIGGLEAYLNVMAILLSHSFAI